MSLCTGPRCYPLVCQWTPGLLPPFGRCGSRCCAHGTLTPVPAPACTSLERLLSMDRWVTWSLCLIFEDPPDFPTVAAPLHLPTSSARVPCSPLPPNASFCFWTVAILIGCGSFHVRLCVLEAEAETGVLMILGDRAAQEVGAAAASPGGPPREWWQL